MKTRLPQHETKPNKRAKQLARDRSDYTFTYDYHHIVSVEHLPLRDKADARWWAAVVEKVLQLEVNKLAAKGEGPDRPGLLARVRKRLSRADPESIVRGKRSRDAGTASAAGVAVYNKLYTTLDAPPVVKVWERDDIFAWQAVAGCNPYMLTAFTQPLPHLKLTDAHVAAALGAGVTVASAMGERKLFLVDYAVLDGLPTGTVGGLQKFNFAPLAVYGVKGGALVPVAIQCTQEPSPVFTPADGASWRMARTTVMTAEGNYQGIISHFALCHQVMESVILSARRQLAPNHPLRVLLEPHFDNTLITNEIAMSNLIGPDGYMERLQAPTLEASLKLATASIADFRLAASSPLEDATRRGVADTDVLGTYPARDDGLRVWGALEPFVREYVELYYTSDDLVVGDVELQGWLRELGAHDGGRLAGIPAVSTVDALVALLARLLFRCTSYHASINYPSFPLMSYPPNVQVSSFGPGPTGGAADTDAALLAMFPPYSVATEALTLFWEITVQLNRLGEYPRGHFSDDRVSPLLESFMERLDAVEAEISAENRSRFFEYPWQLPSRVSRSIHV